MTNGHQSSWQLAESRLVVGSIIKGSWQWVLGTQIQIQIGKQDFCVGDLVSLLGYEARIHIGGKTWEGSDYKCRQ